MSVTSFILDILKFSITGFIVFTASWLVIKKFITETYGAKQTALQREVLQQTLPLKLQAYERIVIFLDRINPSNLLIRLHVSGISAKELQQIILTEVRTEYQHNIAQQLYVSNVSWQVVKRLKDDTLSMINNAANGLSEGASGIELSRTILSHLTTLETNPYEQGASIIISEINRIF